LQISTGLFKFHDRIRDDKQQPPFQVPISFQTGLEGNVMRPSVNAVKQFECGDLFAVAQVNVIAV